MDRNDMSGIIYKPITVPKNSMKNLLFVFIGVLSLFFLCSCSKDNDIQQPTDNSQPIDSETIVIGEYDWINGKRIKLLDLTNSYHNICYVYPLNGKPVKHLAFEKLPKGMMETVRTWGISFPTRVFRTKWKGETVYHLLSLVHDQDYGVFRESGENLKLYQNPEQYVAFIEGQENTECILVLKGEIIKDVTGAKKDLVGMWCQDWQHLTHITDNGHETDIVQLYPDLPFSITEICRFEDDGKGRLITEKTYNDGRKEITVDHFKYKVTDYTAPSAYEYKCYFEAGDTIDYRARSLDGFKTFNRVHYYVNYPWQPITSYPYDENAVIGSKYGTPQPDASNSLVGKWEGSYLDYSATLGKSTFTWVFRSDQTGYLMLDGLFQYSFAYTQSGSTNEAQVTIYKYDTGFTADEGFDSNPGPLIDYDPAILPKGVTMKAKLSGNQLELEGYTWRDANFSPHPIVFQRK